MKAPAKAIFVLLLFALAIGAYWYVGDQTQKTIISEIEDNSLLQVEDYRKGFLSSTFKLISYGGQLRFLGRVDHGPFIFSDKAIGLSTIHISIDPFQVVTSPFRSIISHIPKIKESHIDIHVGLNKAYKITGSIPQLEIALPSDQDGDMVIYFPGMSLSGSGNDSGYSINGLSGATKVEGPNHLEGTTEKIVFSAQGSDILSLIPKDWKSHLTINGLSMSWVDDNSPQSLSVKEIVSTSQSQSRGRDVDTGFLYQLNDLVINGLSLGDIDYSLQLKGLDKAAILQMIHWFSEKYATSQEQGDQQSVQLGSEVWPIFYKVLRRQPELEVRLKVNQPAYGDNEGILQLRLLNTDHLTLSDRLVAGISFDFDRKAAIQLARLSIAGQTSGYTAQEEEKIAEQMIDAFVYDGVLERQGERYLLNASYQGAEQMISYGQNKSFPLDLESEELKKIINSLFTEL